MRYGPQHNETTRERIVNVASRLFREHGSDAVGLAKVMSEAHLTVGTFYTHFDSKEALLREVLRRSLALRHDELVAALRGADLEAVVRAYLSPAHRDAPGSGCPIAALAPEVARHPEETRSTFAAGLAPSVETLAALLSARRGKLSTRGGKLPTRSGKNVKRQEAVAFLGLLVGTLQLARATPDEKESDAILAAGVRAAMQLAA